MNLPVAGRQISSNGISMHLAEAGNPEGELILFMHGFPEFWYGWKHQIPFFAEKGYHVVAPDQRGYNLTDKPTRISAYNLDHLAADMIGVIDESGREKATVIAHDWGGAVAWWMSLRYPERIRKLVILNVAHPIVMRKNIKNNKVQRRKSRYMFFFQLPWLPELSLKRNNFHRFEFMLNKTSNEGTFSRPDIEQYKQAWSQPGALTAMLNWYRAITRTKPAPLESIRVTVPTLLIWGKKDRFLGHEMAEPSIELCDQGELIFFEEATHWIHHEIPDKVNPVIEEFINR